MEKRNSDFTPPHVHILLTIVFMFVVKLIQAQPPNYTVRYDGPASTNFSYTDNVVLGKYYFSSQYTFDGFVMYKTAENPNTFVNDLIIHVIRDNGNLVATKQYELPDNHMVPIACAYNDSTKQYIVTGVARDLFNNGSFNTWYLLLDQGMNFVHLGGIDLEAFPSQPTYNNTFVTDVCPVFNSSGIDFAFTGTILENGIDTAPIGSPPLARRLFITTLNSSTYAINASHYDLNVANTASDDYTFPARIIQIPTANYGGFIVAGTGINNTTLNTAAGLFYLRTDYTLGVYDFENIDYTTNNIGSLFAIGSLFYDSDSVQLYVAGSRNGTSATTDHGFIFDKITRLNSTSGIIAFSLDVNGWNGAIGIKKVPSALVGFPKAGHITQRYTSANINIVGGKVLNNSNTYTMPVLLDCKYQDVDLLSWTTNQNNTIYYYPRNQNVNAPLQGYIWGYNYDQIWYPTHSTTDLLYDAHNTIQQALTGLDESSGDKVVLNLTDNMFVLDNCNEDDDNVTLDMMDVSVVTNTTATQQTPNQSTNTPAYTLTNLSNPNYDGCSGGNPFKSESGGIITDYYRAMYDIEKIKINCHESDTRYSIYDITGKKVLSENIIQQQISIPFFKFASGIYFLQIENNFHEVRNIKINIR